MTEARAGRHLEGLLLLALDLLFKDLDQGFVELICLWHNLCKLRKHLPRV